MKKKPFSLRSAATALALAVAGLTQAAPAPLEKANNNGPTPVNQSSRQEKQTPVKPVRQNREILPDGLGGLDFGYYDRGHSPKEYGQYLQATHKQKWSKRGM